MTRDPVVVLATAPFETAAALMVRHHIRHLPVVDAHDGRLVAGIDDAAVFARGEWVDHAFRLYDRRDQGLKITDGASPVHHHSATTPLARALQEMVERGRDVVVVIDPELRPIGILTAHDVVRIAGWFLSDAVTTRQLAHVHRPVVRRGQTVGEAFDTMRAHRLRHLVVVDGNDAPVAVVAWSDLRAFDAEVRRSRPLSALGLPAVETVPDGAPLLLVADKMVAQKVGALPVVDPNGALVGVVERSDLMRQIVARIGPA